MTQEERNQIWEDVRNRDDEEELEESEEESEIEQLQHEYNQAMSAIERNENQGRPGRNEAWEQIADEKREELIEAKEQRIEELAEYSGEVGHDNYMAISQQNDIRDAIGRQEHEIEELRKEGDN